jgi:serine/threonine protein kinase
LRIVDFGMATSTDVDYFKFPRCGTPGFIAPEIANLTNKKSKYGVKCDIFSLGAIFFKL